MSVNQNRAIIILAAGESRRMGEKIKQLLPYKNTTLISNAIREAKRVNMNHLVVVLGANFEIIKESIEDESVTIIKNNNWSEGMGSSIVAGMQHLLSLENNLNGVLIMLADQPYIDYAFLSSILNSVDETNTNIIATAYENGAGVPAYFDKSCFDELLKLNKDFGARKIMKNNNAFLVNPEGKELDIDTWDEYQELINL